MKQPILTKLHKSGVKIQRYRARNSLLGFLRFDYVE